MVSSCALSIDELELTGQKTYVPYYLSALFQEADRVENRNGTGDIEVAFYRCSRDTILRRLDLLGCTAKLAEQRFNGWREEEISEQKEYLEYSGDDGDDDTLEALSALSWDEWRRRVSDVLRTQYDFGRLDSFHDEIDRCMKEGEPPWLWYDGFDSLISLRAIIDASQDSKFVTLDVEPLIGGGWIGHDEKICDAGHRVASSRGQPGGPIVLLAEGKSDIAILKATLITFHPDLSDYIAFLDHSDFRVDGGASFVVKFLKAFAAARIRANVVAVFDNDAAGLAALNDAMALGLPANMTCLHLPDIELGRSYPTIGPQGTHDSDINGKACGIELYLGKTALSNACRAQKLHRRCQAAHWYT